jgi:hypothetical protein
MSNDKQKVILRLNLDGNWSLKEMANFFQSMRYVHASVDFVFEDINRQNFPSHDSFAPYKRLLSKDWIFYRFLYHAKMATGTADHPFSEYFHWHREYTLSHIWPSDDLFLESIHLASAGWVDILGKWNPLEFIKDFFLLFRDYKSEKKRRELENKLLENKVIRERMAILREAGFSDKEVKEFVLAHVITPVSELPPYYEKGLITGAELIELPQETGASETNIDSDISGYGRAL